MEKKIVCNSCGKEDCDLEMQKPFLVVSQQKLSGKWSNTATRKPFHVAYDPSRLIPCPTMPASGSILQRNLRQVIDTMPVRWAQTISRGHSPNINSFNRIVAAATRKRMHTTTLFEALIIKYFASSPMDRFRPWYFYE